MSDRPTAIIADGETLSRAALRMALERDAGFTVVGEAPDGNVAQELVEHLQPSVVVLDVELPQRDGVRTCAAIKSGPSTTRVLLVSAKADQAVLLEGLEAGADGYIGKDSPLSELLEATQTVASGHAWVPPRMLGILLRSLIERRREEDVVLERFSRLTRREKEVLALLVDGNDRDDIAEALVISPETARTHIQNVLGKLEVHSRLEATALVLAHNLVERFTPRSSK